MRSMKRLQEQKNLELVRRIEQILKGFGVSKGDQIVVGVSGGPDSVCLLHLLKTISEHFTIRFHIAHLNHQLRGQESTADARFVEDLGTEWRIPVSVESVSVLDLAKQKKISVQVAAREARYLFFERVAEKTQSRWVALGHTADDQAETFLLRLLRGAGGLGLSSIPPLRKITGIGGPGSHIIRPLLSVRRDEVLDYLRTRSIPYREDPSNLKPLYRRNRLRQEVVPLLTSHYNPRLVETLCRSAELLREEQEFLIAQSTEVLSKLQMDSPPSGIALNLPGYLSLHRALQRVVLREAILRVRGDLVGITYRHLEDALELIISRRTGKCLNMPRQTCLRLLYDRFWIYPPQAEDQVASERLEDLTLSIPGEIDVPPLGFLVRVSLQEGYFSSDPRHCAAFDYAKIHSPFSIRARREGDYFFPSGRAGKKKLQDFFVDQKIPRHERDRIPLLTASEGILWVMGWRLDGRFIASPNSQKVMVVELKQRGNS